MFLGSLSLLCSTGQGATSAQAPKGGMALQPLDMDYYVHSDCWLKYSSGYAGPFTGVNPTSAEIFGAIRALSVQYKVPVEIIGAVCFQESGAYQYGADGFVVHNLTECRALYYGAAGAPPGLGLMQLTGSTAEAFNLNRLVTDWRYNLEAGVEVLKQKRDYAISLDPSSLQTIENANWNVLENWRYALAHYNGYSIPENPYVASVCGLIASPPARLSGLFSGVTLTRPQDVIAGFVYGKGFAVKPDNSWLYYNGLTYYGAAHLGIMVNPANASYVSSSQKCNFTYSGNSYFALIYDYSAGYQECATAGFIGYSASLTFHAQAASPMATHVAYIYNTNVGRYTEAMAILNQQL